MPDFIQELTKVWPSTVVFDLDGTLVDSAEDIAESLNQLLAIERLPPFSLGEAVDFIGDGISVLIARAFSARGRNPDADEFTRLLSTFRTIYGGRLTQRTRTYSGVVELVAALSAKGVTLAVCTNKEESLAQGIIDGLGLSDCFAVVVGGMPERPRKPSPLPLLEALVRLGAKPRDAIMVGDSAVDMNCARNAGVAFVGVTFGYSRPPITRLGAQVTIDSYSEFPAACELLRSTLR